MAHDAPQAPVGIRAQRRAAVRKGLVGLAVLVPLLLALTFLGEDERAPEGVPTSTAVSAAGGIASPLPASPAPQIEAQPVAPVVEPAPVASAAVETPSEAPPEVAPAHASIGTAQNVAGSVAAAEAPDVAAPLPVAERRYPPPPPGNGYMVQLGVFTDTENAAKLLLELAAAGHPVYLQSRVVLGPYPDKAAAQRAQEKIRRERKLDGMIVPPRKP